jgi:hypothetical protein
MKKTIAAAAAVLGLLIGLPASAGVIGFNGPYAPGTWVTTITGNTGGSNGSAIMTNTTLVLTSGNSANGCPGGQFGLNGPCQISIINTHIENPFTFHWAYTTADSAGPAGDIFGIIVDGIRIQLSDPGGPINQSGNITINNAHTSFGWFMNCTDCIEGAATATITNFQAPEPTSLLLLGLALASFYVMRRRVA